MGKVLYFSKARCAAKYRQSKLKCIKFWSYWILFGECLNAFLLKNRSMIFQGASFISIPQEPQLRLEFGFFLLLRFKMRSFWASPEEANKNSNYLFWLSEFSSCVTISTVSLDLTWFLNAVCICFQRYWISRSKNVMFIKLTCVLFN